MLLLFVAPSGFVAVVGEIDDQISFVAVVHEINLLLGFGAVFHEVPEASVAACLVPVVAFIGSGGKPCVLRIDFL